MTAGDVNMTMKPAEPNRVFDARFDKHTPLPAHCCFASAAAMTRAIRARSVTCMQIMEAHLTRLESVNPKLNAVVALDPERALSEAFRQDEKLASGELIGPLHGLPITIKDSLDTFDFITTGGTSGRRGYRPDKDATVVARLRAAGAIVVGKTNTPELTLGDVTDNDVYGRTNNPYDLQRSPTGSSGGAAAIIAAGGSPLDLGSDTGGSIRGPAHVCGIAGLKPTSGRVPGTGHITPPGFGAIGHFTQVGPMARYVEDLQLSLPIIAGPDGSDPNVMPVPLGHADDVDLKDLRVLAFTDNAIIVPDPDIAQSVLSSAEALKERVASIEFRCPELLPEGIELFVRLYQADGGASIERLLSRCATRNPTADLAGIISAAKEVHGGDFSAIMEQVSLWRGRFLALLQDYDAIMCPPLPCAAELHDAVHEDRYLEWSYAMVFNIAGWPAGVVRTGATSSGLPIGIQIAAGPWREDVVLALAAGVEEDSGGFEAPCI